MWHQVSSFSLAEHILELMVFFWNVGKVDWFNFGVEKAETDAGSVLETEMVSVKTVEPGKQAVHA